MFDNSKIKRAVSGWDCKIKFKEGIKQTIEYFQNNPGMMAIDHTWNSKVDKLIQMRGGHGRKGI